MSWDRRRRLEAHIKEKVAIIVTERLSDPRLGFLTITRVELSRDKKIARIYYTVLGQPGQRRATARALESAAPHIQEVLGPSLKTRTVPELRFHFDDQIEKESRMRALLEDLAAERDEQGDDDLDALGGGEPDFDGADDGGADDGGAVDAGAGEAQERHRRDVETPDREG